MMTPARRSGDKRDEGREHFRDEAARRIESAERETGVQLTDEWRAFLIALAAPEMDDEPKGELE